MTGPTANCPSCGGDVAFRWSGAVQTTCPYCDSILVRHGTDLERVGQVSEPPPETSRIQLGTEGAYKGRRFQVVGRIVYGYERGTWNEWHVIFDDGASGWLSDSMDEYAVTFQRDLPEGVPPEDQIGPGQPVFHDGDEFTVTDTTPARYRSTEGELPWEYHDKDYLTFADMKTATGEMATLDYSEDPPLLFRGEYVSFESLRLTGLRDVEEEKADEVRTLSCPNCGASVTVLRSGMSVNVVCESCSSVLDAKSEGAEVLQTFQARMKHDPLIPVGATGRIKGSEYTCLGYQVRSVTSEGMIYSWDEYLLHNPEDGFRYLTQENGHWNDVVVLKSVPKEIGGTPPRVKLHGETFKHFEHGIATTEYVLGEWPWEVRVDDKVRSDDYVNPPLLLSRESTADEDVWSMGRYVSGAYVWDSFSLEGDPPPTSGVYPNQPSPHEGKAGKLWATFALLFLILVVGWGIRMALPNSRLVASDVFIFEPGADNVEVIGPFTVEGRPSNLALDTRAGVSNSWIYLDFQLLNTGTGQVWELGREVSYYFGRDSEGRWTEGSQTDRAYIPGVPAGEYMLRIAPQGQTRESYGVEIRRDVPPMSHYTGALILLLLPPLTLALRSASFESKRWEESDYAEDD